MLWPLWPWAIGWFVRDIKMKLKKQLLIIILFIIVIFLFAILNKIVLQEMRTPIGGAGDITIFYNITWGSELLAVNTLLIIITSYFIKYLPKRHMELICTVPI